MKPQIENSLKIYSVIKEHDGGFYVKINSIEYRFSLSEAVRGSDERNIANCGDWWPNGSCWIVYGKESTKGFTEPSTHYGIYNGKTNQIKVK